MVAKIDETLPLLRKQVDARRELAAKGLSSKLLLWQLEEQLVERQRNRNIQQQTAARARAAIANLDMQLAELRQSFAKEAVARKIPVTLAEAEDNASLRAEELRKSETRRGLQQLRAPVDGTVQQLGVHTLGGVVQPAQALMVIVPEQGDLIVEAQLLNKDRGFVREGQRVRVKFEAFPFTDYGLIEGRVEHISRDAVPGDGRTEQGSPASDASRREPSRGLVYTARIRLDDTVMRVGREVIPLGPGMAVQAEIRTGTRRIIQYLLSPIMKTVEEAGRER
ncbi:HlyD family type I secretion periplasmic adaptor subunit [Sphingosinicellaceae bacterium M-36]